ncbi:transposase (plasmid) [Acidovorax sp. DW039]|uniref:transposase n=1 Tax=Acidovorax sp. DW039 TaxID=3095606 RepID=UPI00308903E5|nr:transposase [Acidovorax sp. DW039]
MKKYKTEFKLKVVRSFLAGEGGARLLARRWSVPEEKVRTWVSHYRLRGIDGLRPKRSAYSAQFKLQVLAHQDREQLPVFRSRRSMTSAIPTRSWSGGAISIKAACRRARPGMKNIPR